MKAQTIRTTANNLIEALELDRQQCIRVAKFEIQRMQNEEDAKDTIKRHNEHCDDMIRTLCMLYITAYDGKQINKMNEELNAQMERVYAMRVDFWDDVKYAD